MLSIQSPFRGIVSPFGNRASVAALSAYAVLGSEPQLVFDSSAGFYRKAGAATTFGSLVTYTGASNKTMVDSAGVLKWAPHNLLLQSNTLGTSPWSASIGSTVTVNGDGSWTFDPSGSTSRFLSQTGTGSGTQTTFAIEAKPGTASWMAVRTINFAVDDLHYYDITTGAVGAIGGTYPQNIEPLDDGWYLIKLAIDTSVDNSGNIRIYAASGDETISGGTIQLRNARFYRSDLGGMADNPDRGDSYVPTTDAAVYMDRRDHHKWNGSAWVKVGRLESEARTNLLHTTNALVTQSYTVTAVPHTLSFTGTGTVTLSGASTAGPLVGTGTGENNRVNLTFTPTAASLTLTVSGTVTNAQLEIGSVPSSYIPNTAASGTVTRAAETLTIAGADMPYSATAMSFAVSGEMDYADLDSAAQQTIWRWQADANNYMSLDVDTDGAATGEINANQAAASVVDSVAGANITAGLNRPYNIASRHTSGAINVAVAGTAATADTTPTALPSLAATTFQIGFDHMGSMPLISGWSMDLADAGIEEASS